LTEPPGLVVVQPCHEFLGYARTVPFAVVFNFAEHFNLPIRQPTAKRNVAHRFGLRVLHDALQGSLTRKVRVFIAVLRSFGARL
jgi:hypothetical protein